MLLLKPCYGQIDAPRGWYLEAVDRLRRGGLRQHALDTCAFLIYETDDVNYNPEDPVHEKVKSLGPQKLVGMVIMHVDDLLGVGCMDSPRYRSVVEQLKSNFSFREWKENQDSLEYCGCEIEKTPGRKIQQTKYLEKVMPIAVDKKRSPTDGLREREVTQLRGWLGSLQWPAVQTSPHLQRSTSLLSGLVNKGTIQTLMDTNRLLKFAKENKDIGLTYNHIGECESLRLLCFFDAGFSTRNDGSSQGGYILMLINGNLMHSDEEGQYHVLDWRSFKTPRVARSSLGAEAQAGGQASDAVDFTRRYWHHLLEPDMALKDLLNIRSTLKPVMVSDAKALYDAYHRESASSSVIDKRVSLEIRVMKERLQEIDGVLKWMSSDRQIADGLTKEAARVLFATRLRHQKLKPTWDPSYKAMKKKSKGEKLSALAETTSVPKVPVRVWHQQHEENYIPESEEVQENLAGDSQESVNFVGNALAVTYVYATARHVESRKKYVSTGRMKNVLFWLTCFAFVFTSCHAAETCDKLPVTTSEPANDDGWLFWMIFLLLTHLLVMASSCRLCKCLHWAPVKASSEAGVQKDEAIVSARLREVLEKEKLKSEESQKAAREARKALDLCLMETHRFTAEIFDLKALVKDGAMLLRRAETAMDDHMEACPHRVVIVSSRQGDCWHYPECHMVEQMADRNRQSLRCCAYCGNKWCPLDVSNPALGGSLRAEIHAWFADVNSSAD